MQPTAPLPLPARVLIVIVILTYLAFFLLEAICWMMPLIYNILVPLLDNPVDLPVPVQAITLRNLFVNQGFYNLFIACGGIYGLLQVKRGSFVMGYAFILFACISAVGAGLVLAFTTKAWLLATLQALPALVAAFLVLPKYRHT